MSGFSVGWQTTAGIVLLFACERSTDCPRELRGRTSSWTEGGGRGWRRCAAIGAPGSGVSFRNSAAASAAAAGRECPACWALFQVGQGLPISAGRRCPAGRSPSRTSPSPGQSRPKLSAMDAKVGGVHPTGREVHEMSAPLSAQRCLPLALPSRPSLGCHRHCPAWLPNRYRTVVRELSGLRMLRVSYWTGRSGPGPAPPSDSKNDGSCASHSGTCFPCVAPVRKSVPRLVFIFFFYFNCSFSIFFFPVPSLPHRRCLLRPRCYLALAPSPHSPNPDPLQCGVAQSGHEVVLCISHTPLPLCSPGLSRLISPLLSLSCVFFFVFLFFFLLFLPFGISQRGSCHDGWLRLG